MQPVYTRLSAYQRHAIGEPSNWTEHAVREHEREPLEVLHANDLEISLLGTFQVRAGGRVIVESDWPLRRARNLVKLLALAPGHHMHREQIIDHLWPEQTQDAATNNLHKALHVARHVLEPNLPAKAVSRYIRLQGELVVLCAPGLVRVDVEHFRALAEAAYKDDSPEAYLKALSLYVDDLLPQDQYEDWAITHRERIKHLRLELLLRLARVYDEHEATDTAIQVLQQVVEVDPAHEEAYGRLMVLLTRSGARQTALRQYHRLETALKDELDAEPAPAIQKLYHDVLENRLPEQKRVSLYAYPDTGTPMHAAVPPQVVGREQEVRELVAYLHAAAGGVGRLVIVDGEAGSGKTHVLKSTASYAIDQGFTTLTGEASTGAVQLPHSYISSALADFARRARAPDRFIMEAANIAHMLTPVPGTYPSLPWGSTVGNLRQASVSHLIEGFFKNLCIHAPVLFMLDDAQLADEASLQIVKALVESIDRLPLLLVVSVRQFDTDQPSPQRDILTALSRYAGVTLTLHPLAFSETAALVSQLLGAPVERSVLETIHSIAGGLPHFIQETAFALMGRNGIQLVDGRWTLCADEASGLARHNLRQPRLDGVASSGGSRNNVPLDGYSQV